jgi:hypothetical protein
MLGVKVAPVTVALSTGAEKLAFAEIWILYEVASGTMLQVKVGLRLPTLLALVGDIRMGAAHLILIVHAASLVNPGANETCQVSAEQGKRIP